MERDDVTPELPPRMREVVKRMAQCQNTKSISGELGISTKTVEYHLGKFRARYKIRSIAQLVHFALFHGLCENIYGKPETYSEAEIPSMADVEKAHMLNVLSSCNHNRTHAARILGISTRGLRYKLNKVR